MLTIEFTNNGVTLLASKISGVSLVTVDGDTGEYYVEVYCDGITHIEPSYSEKCVVSFRKKILDILNGVSDGKEW